MWLSLAYRIFKIRVEPNDYRVPVCVIYGMSDLCGIINIQIEKNRPSTSPEPTVGATKLGLNASMVEQKKKKSSQFGARVSFFIYFVITLSLH